MSFLFSLIFPLSSLFFDFPPFSLLFLTLSLCEEYAELSLFFLSLYIFLSLSTSLILSLHLSPFLCFFLSLYLTVFLSVILTILGTIASVWADQQCAQVSAWGWGQQAGGHPGPPVSEVSFTVRVGINSLAGGGGMARGGEGGWDKSKGKRRRKGEKEEGYRIFFPNGKFSSTFTNVGNK